MAKDKDEKLSEQDALARADKEGISFIDEWVLGEVGNTTEWLPEKYNTAEEAETARQALKNPDKYQVIQTRRRAA
jgi:hypothetical protein